MEPRNVGPYRPSPRWNVVAVGVPFVGFVAGVIVGTAGNGILWDGHPMDGAMWGFRAWFGFAVLGQLAAAIAFLRKERWWGVTAVGVVLNLATLAFCGMFIRGR